MANTPTDKMVMIGVDQEGKREIKTISVPPTTLVTEHYVIPASFSLQDRARAAARMIQSKLLPRLDTEDKQFYQELCCEKKVADLLEAAGNIDSEDVWTEWILWIRTKGRFALVTDPKWSKEDLLSNMITAQNRARFAGHVVTMNLFEILCMWKNSRESARAFWHRVAKTDPSPLPSSSSTH